jgi:metal-sulfur cluster biosynthetic enzyme
MNVESNNEALLQLAVDGLFDVIDPEIGLNVVDLGLIYRVDFDVKAKKLVIGMTLTTQFCPMGESITKDVNESLAGSFPGWEIKVDLTFNPPWNYSRISVKGNEFLGR